ncbi:type II secretion system protein [Alkalibacillus haloalkaliphilus]|uniref:type II secretion system protein n=1 Tax=Alkalibacillus haloalkaliphilus TaxID=94136 RepID=UPI002936C88A|nr:type II secretion system protein [Alkalibacillus haloalkaliphilus]MDV2581859.1 type II secretion system protein [Alkalibacillus haloalkaliphilus]
MKNQKGITLVELLAVIVILGIIALIAVPAIASVIDDSRYDSAKATAINIIEAAELYSVTNDLGDGDTVTAATLASDGYLEGFNEDNWTNNNEPEVTINTGSPNTLTGDYNDENIEISFDGDSIEAITEMNQ